MVHTLPDYTSKWKTKTISAIADNAELAVRLGSIDTFDRRGNVVWMDDFEGIGQKWRYSYSFAVGTTTLSATRCYRGSTSMKQVTNTNIDDYAEIWKILPNPSNSSLGIEATLYQDDSSGYYVMYLLGYTGTTYYSAAVKWDWATHNVYYQDDTPGWVLLDSVPFKNWVDEYWLPIKIVLDWSTFRYKRIIVGENEYDMSAFDLYHAASVQRASIQIRIGQHTAAAAAKTGYVDNVILTQNEV